MKLLPRIQAEGGAEWLARTATQCLIDEARLSPKPGLVDSRGNGAHHDLTLALMERSAHSLTPTFQALALQSWQRPADIALRQTVGRLGREGEQQMMGRYRRREHPPRRDLGAGAAGERGGDARRRG
ncbi:2-(5''-triphosphoribosyl)-3'-dephosphocoenzyme- A synthase [Salmonella enterica subsp. arizonae]|uniref:2-(5''-triphosphoribosyl)-3'-dephosphocoenzyme-A synthase n=1 Tax=Salmonella enterica subsp. arizonae TaxID=59203 RepID=A0A379SQW6_SALER|nr:2-(5''-triphosphoribosyl)-3'-dephosphocoenzyme- A synthase [Salmonella enterica subsp. arizonae]